MTPEQKIQQLGLSIPAVAEPVGAYVPAVRTANLVFTSGQLPSRDGTLMAAGKVPSEVSLVEAKGAARQAAVNALAAVRGAVGTLDAVTHVVRMNCFVNSAAGFQDQSQVADGASELLEEVFGDAGKHTRCAIGAAEMPRNAPVEIDLIVQVQ